jgi:hypothetical protein
MANGTCGGLKMTGGKRTRKAGKGGRKTRKLSPKLKAWNEKVMKVFADMRKKDKKVSFRAALVEAGKLRKAGKI